jgi:protocatechuate 3,4-dioxygenase beta subunit
MSRRFALTLAAVLALWAAQLGAASAQRDTLCRDREPESAQVRIAAEGEPGEPLAISGRVLVGPDRAPGAGARVVAYHTDARGYYSAGGMDERNARLCGVLRADAEGRYRFETIRPAHYATGGPPAHVHFEVTLPGDSMRRLSLQFEGDPLLAGKRGVERWDDVRPVAAAADGTLLVERDLWIR